jgi:hypothetical protein
MQLTNEQQLQLVCLYKNKDVEILQKFNMYNLKAKDSLLDIK